MPGCKTELHNDSKVLRKGCVGLVKNWGGG